MAEVAKRTQIRQVGPQPVSRRSHNPAPTNRHQKHESSPPRSKDDSLKHRSKPKQHSSTSKSLSHTCTSPAAIPSASSYNLDIMGGPPSSLEAGYTTFEPSVLISSYKHSRTSNLIAVASLLYISSTSGTITPLPSGYLNGPRLCDNIHSLPRGYVAKLPRDLRESAMGYVSFPGLVVARPGYYRLRISLLKVSDVGVERQGTTTVGTVDSSVVKVIGGCGYE